jgi:hypothetical protein
MVQGIKWGADRVYLGELVAEGKPRLTDLAAHVAKRLRPDFKESGLLPYNDTFDFVFDAEGRKQYDESRNIAADQGWQFNDEGNVKIDCTCTNAPKPGDTKGKKWTVKWTGVWDRKKQDLIPQKMEHKPLPD